MEGAISPDDVLRHPVAAAITAKIQSERNVIVWGPSGGGKSMFVNAYMDKHVGVRGSTRKLLDSSTTPSDLLEDDQSVREGSYGFIMVDGIAWTKASIRFFFQKVPAKTKIVLILPVPIKNAQDFSTFPNVFVPASIHPTETYTFFRDAGLPYFPLGNPRAFYEDYLLTRGNFARLLSRYMYGCAFMDADVSSMDVWTSCKSLEDSVKYIARVPPSKAVPFHELCSGDIRLLAEALETRSLMDIQYVDIYGDENARTQIRQLLLGAEVFRQLRHGFV